MITVFADASFMPQTKAAGWGAWIKVDGRRGEIFGAKIKVAVASSQEAELFAMANALTIAAKIDPQTPIMLQSDCLYALNMLAERVPNSKASNHEDGAKIVPRFRRPKPREIDAVKSIIATLAGRRLLLRHVRGHKEGGSRQWVNNACDRVAKKWARSVAADLI